MQHALWIRHIFFTVLFACLCAAGNVAPRCDEPALHAAGYAHSIKSIERLPEWAAWTRSHSFPVTYGQSVDRQVLMHGRCYWSVSVYANRPERLELWRVFYVNLSGKPVLVQDTVSGDAISLQTWRTKGAGRVYP
ncbi:hypothetical protein [Polaromonas sp. YR568]|uniref:hypothetical protein n=1 Tax=Polaromonas sp. YR568 TaxID=1855301 RepID=UPI00398BE588